MIIRGLRFEAIVAPPVKNVICLHNLAVAEGLRGKERDCPKPSLVSALRAYALRRSRWSYDQIRSRRICRTLGRYATDAPYHDSLRQIQKNPQKRDFFVSGGERGIRTLEGLFKPLLP
jgi:hypothetical protein